MGVSSEILIYVPRDGKHITGEAISGFVRIRLDKDTVYRNISLSLVEKGQFQWQATSDTMVQTHETILVEKMYLLNNITNENGNITLSAGSHELPFEIIIPENVPPSIKTSIGEIKYHLVLKFKKPELLSWNKTFKKKVVIYPRVDSSLSGERIIATLNKTLCSLFSSKEREIYLEAVLDKEYLNPGRGRNISFAVKNNSNLIIYIKTELICITKYKIPKHKQSANKKKTINFSTVETPKIPGNSQISNISNIIPVALEICTVRHSNVLSREYKLRVTLKLPCPHLNSTVEIPVFVGESVAANGGELGESSVRIEDPPSYWETMQEFKAAAIPPQKRT